jgi:hypothetical protein
MILNFFYSEVISERIKRVDQEFLLLFDEIFRSTNAL